VVAAADAPPPIPAFPPSIYEGVNNSLSSATSTTNLVVSSPQYHVLPTATTPVDDDVPFDPKAQKYHRGVSRLPSSRAPGGTSLTSPSAASPSSVSAVPNSAATIAAAPAQDPRPPLPIRSSSLGILRSVMPRPRIDPAASVAAAVAATSPSSAATATPSSTSTGTSVSSSPSPPVPSSPLSVSAPLPADSHLVSALVVDDMLGDGSASDAASSPASARRNLARRNTPNADDTLAESPRKMSAGSGSTGDSHSPPASPRLLASLAATTGASTAAAEERDFSSLPALLAYFVTLEKGYADDLQETMHKVKQQLEGCLEQDLSVGEGTAILELFRALPELHDLARKCVHLLPPMTPIGSAARVLASLSEPMNNAHCRFASLLAITSAPLAALAANERRAPRAQPPSATWQHLVAQAASMTKSGARVPLAAQLQRPLKAVERHASMARALRRYAVKSGVVDESTLIALDTAVTATAASAADVSAAWAAALGRARLAAVFDKLSRSKSGRRSGLLQHDRTLRQESLDIYIGKTRHCFWLFSDFLLLVRPTRDNKSYDLVWEQELGPACEPVSAEASKKLGPNAFVLRCGKTKKFEMETASDVEAQRWIAAINK
jgi:hypothetical protein